MINKLTAIVVFLLLLVTTLTFQQTAATTTSSPLTSLLLPSPVTMGQATTSTSPSPLSSSTPLTAPLTPPLTSQELEQQTRLQNAIAATTANLNETEKQVSGVVFTPRWSEPVWINANSMAVLVAYCLPGEFADSGQEILGGFELEVLESYSVALPQDFMAWMAIVGNQDVQNGRRLPAALGVICASDLNNAQARVLSPEEQQQISSINQQITTTNVENVVNVISDVGTGTSTPPTAPTQNETGGGDGGGGTTTPPSQQPPTGQGITAEIIASPTEGFAPLTVKFEAKIYRGGQPYTEPYESYFKISDGTIKMSPIIEHTFGQAGDYRVYLIVTTSLHGSSSVSIPITVKEHPREGGAIPPDDIGGAAQQLEGPSQIAPVEGGTGGEGGPQEGGAATEQQGGETGEQQGGEEPGGETTSTQEPQGDETGEGGEEE